MLIKLWFFFIIYVVFLSPFDLRADTGAAKSAWDKAYNDYYEAILPLKNPTSTQLNELHSKIVEPAESEYVLEKHREHLKYNPLNSGKMSEERKREKSADKVHAEIPNNKTPTFATPSRYTPSSSSREEVVLDGSNIPKELEFSGVKGRKLNPTPQSRGGALRNDPRP